MNPPVASIAALSLLLVSLARAETVREPFSEIRPLSPTGIVRIANDNGAIEVRTWKRNEVRIAGEKEASSPEDLREIEIVIDAEPSRLSVEPKIPSHPGNWLWHSGHNQSVHFSVTVPEGVTLEKISDVNGSIQIDGVQGAVTAANVNGSIRCSGLAGNVSLDTVNGSIHATFAALRPEALLRFDTVNGSVHALFPGDIGATVHASTVNGRVHCDFPMTAASNRRTSLSAQIGSGSAQIKATTVNGGIEIGPIGG